MVGNNYATVMSKKANATIKHRVHPGYLATDDSSLNATQALGGRMCRLSLVALPIPDRRGTYLGADGVRNVATGIAGHRLASYARSRVGDARRVHGTDGTVASGGRWHIATAWTSCDCQEKLEDAGVVRWVGNEAHAAAALLLGRFPSCGIIRPPVAIARLLTLDRRRELLGGAGSAPR